MAVVTAIFKTKKCFVASCTVHRIIKWRQNEGPPFALYLLQKFSVFPVSPLKVKQVFFNFIHLPVIEVQGVTFNQRSL